MINLSEEFSGNYLKAKARYRINEDAVADAALVINSIAPNFNFLLFQSDYVNYNWQNDFDNIQKQDLSVNLKSKKWANVSAHLTQINNFTYFGLEDNPNGVLIFSVVVKPAQYDNQ